MEKKLENYLHLYIGCEIEAQGFNSDAERLELTANRLAIFGRGHYKEIKPIIRLLSDMTEEEKQEFSQISDADFTNLISDGEDGFIKVEAQQTLYLLSKHFDLFGLIEAGLAIDKTTLK